MARGKKKEVALSPDERLQAALVPESEQPYKVPENWCWVRLGALLSQIKNGTTIKQDKSGIGYKVTRIESLQNQTIDFDRLGTIINEHEIKDTDWYQAGDIALSHINSAEHVGKTALINADMLPLVHGMNLLRLRFYSGCCLPQFFQFFSQSFQYKGEVLSRINMAVNQVSINQKQISSLEIPLPPFLEQQRIVDRIESMFAKLDEAKQKAQDALDSFETRKAAILHKAFTGELTAQWRKKHRVGMESWETKRLSDVSALQTGLMKGKHYIGKTVMLPYLRVANVQDGFLNLNEIKEIEVSEELVDRYLLKNGDVLFTEGRDYDKLGRGTVWREQIQNCLHQNHIFVVRPDTSVLNPYFLSYQAGSRYGKQYFLKCSKQTTNLASINSTQLKGFPVLMPSIEEQVQIVSLIDNLLAKEQQAKEAAEKVLEQIDLTKKAILARAFRGELGTNDPSEESAVGLVEKIIVHREDQDAY